MAASPSGRTSRLAGRPADSIASRMRNTSALLSSTTRIRGGASPARSDADGEEEGRPFSGLGFNPDTAVVSVHDTLANSQADARSRVFTSCVQPFEKAKNLLLVLRFNAD